VKNLAWVALLLVSCEKFTLPTEPSQRLVPSDDRQRTVTKSPGRLRVIRTQPPECANAAGLSICQCHGVGSVISIRPEIPLQEAADRFMKQYGIQTSTGRGGHWLAANLSDALIRQLRCDPAVTFIYKDTFADPSSLVYCACR